MIVESAPLPEWAKACLPAFRGVLRVVDLSSGFTLVPVEVSGPDVARVLGEYLAGEGHGAEVVAPVDDAAWGRLVRDLFALPPAPNGVVVVVGPREVSPPVAAALRLVNQRRDTLAHHLDRALLWCGPHAFLDATWEIAPDFWSVRAMTHTVEGVLALPPEPPCGPSRAVSDGVDRLRALFAEALRLGDAPSIARLALHLASALEAELGYEETDSVAVTALGAGPAGGSEASLALVRAQAALLRGRTEDAEAHLAAARALANGGDAVDGEIALVAGNVALVRGAADGARASYLEAESRFRAAGDARNAGVARWSLANADVAREDLEGAARAFGEALDLFREIADARDEARALSSLGRVHAALLDMRTANGYFDDALAVARAAGDRHGEATVLRRLARVYVTLGDPEKAVEDCTRALAIARELGDLRGEGKSLTVLGAAHAALGDPARARVLLDAAMALADRLADVRMRSAVERTRRSLPP